MQQAPPTQQEQPLATVRPMLYIDVVINNQKQVYEIVVARELYTQLGLALKSLEVPLQAIPPESATKRKVRPAPKQKRGGSKGT